MTEQDHEIYNWLVSKSPCAPQFDPIQKAWEAGDSLTMYQTMLGNWWWCVENDCPLDRLELEELAGGIAKFWYGNGQLRWETHWENGVPHGVERRFYDNGQLHWEIPYKNGELHGAERGFYGNGQLRWEIPYKNGELHGAERGFYDNGQLWQETHWENGVRRG